MTHAGDREALNEAQLALRNRPPGKPAMWQKWRSLLFLHASFDPAQVQELLPKELTVDTFPDHAGRERAWVGLVPFRMEGIRLRGLPPIPGTSAFPETNVRTYVKHQGVPGVWFFTLDATNLLACLVARHQFSLNYREARMWVRDGSHYESVRAFDGAMVNIDCTFGAGLPTPEPGSLEFFLVERYLLYAIHRGRLHSGRVYHTPYQVRSASTSLVQETMIQAIGLGGHTFEHAMASDGVDVEVFPLMRV